jgi:predicted AAA+ superfamily ATPase
LEDIETRQYAQSDPKGFLRQHPDGALIDEIQYAPDLLSYIQVLVDEDSRPGRFILTGSQQFSLMAGVSQSLAGRTALVTLLPFSCEELPKTTIDDINQLMVTGSYPRVYDRDLNPTEAASFYLRTYVERDVRQLLQVENLAQFERFLKFCAGRSGQLLNIASLSGDSGLDSRTIKRWLSVLETSYIITLLPPAHENINKRLSKTPKLYFLDTGLLCYLLGITSSDQLAYHPLKGNIFETLVVSECYKQRYHAVRDPNFSYYRDQQHEVDLIDSTGTTSHAIEIKAAGTFSPEFLKSLRYYHSHHPNCTAQTLVYSGTLQREASGVRVLPFGNIGQSLF